MSCSVSDLFPDSGSTLSAEPRSNSSNVTSS
eukprot:CAMPEP_0171294334 /NCGR_PEP_ID=MMETSP0816-20121228/2804_1 /TAXON_ID=420281 /ORGANISM="Proboscia inermis, Strain CCAP1064/1" /LENGTH=30 /DNA_ID= /DNA_START= /DNA_END= /DNA_ORIENTATION=